MNKPSSFENDTEIFHLIDKYLKANNNYLPLQSYLDYLETDTFDSFGLISNVKHRIDNNVSTVSTGANLSASLTMIKEKLNSSDLTDEFDSSMVLAQKLYKMIISIDYSPQTSMLGFIKLALEKTFEKISYEYDEYFQNCAQVEPQIYITVILWNSMFFNESSNVNGGYPFMIICHSKRLLKSNIHEMAAYIYERIEELKYIFLDMLKQQALTNEENKITSQFFNNHHNNTNNYHQNSNHNSNQYPYSRSRSSINGSSPFEEILLNVIKIFNYFCVNDLPSSASAPTALALSHHIYITEGLIYTNDMVKFLERISKSSITFSFIYSGSTKLNLSSGFGYMADHFLMKFISKMTNGYFAVIDEYSDYSVIISKSFFKYIGLSLSRIAASHDNQNMTKHSIGLGYHDDNKSLVSSPQSINLDPELMNTQMGTSYDENENEESRDSFCQLSKSPIRSYEKKPLSTNKSTSNKSRSILTPINNGSSSSLKAGATTSSSNSQNVNQQIKNLFKNDLSENNEQQFEMKCIQKYEMSQKQTCLYQIARIRSQEGFFLAKITKQLVRASSKSHHHHHHHHHHHSNTSPKKYYSSANSKTANAYLITLYFKRYFTQTTIFIYKISYYVPCTVSVSTDNKDSHDNTLGNQSTSMSDLMGKSPIVKNQDLNDKSLDSDTTTKLNSTDTKPVNTSSSHTSSKFHVEIWISWNFLHLKAKYQNLVLLDQVKNAIISIQNYDSDRSFELTPSMLNPPNVLKQLTEPLFKIIVQTQMKDQHLNNNSSISPVFTLQNLEFELNLRSNKNMDQEFIDFANAWVYLAFFKYNKNVLNRYFGLHTIKLILDHDGPVPDISTAIFDMKNTALLMTLEMIPQISNSNRISQFGNINPEQIINNIGIGNINQSTLKNTVFQCQNSLNKLCVMLMDWSDIILVENCVYLKFLCSSSRLKTKTDQSGHGISSDQKGESHKPNQAHQPNEDQSKKSAFHKTDHYSNINDEETASSLSLSSLTSQNTNKIVNNNSFVIIRLETQNQPYVSLQFLFHSNTSYMDRVCVIEKFKLKLKELNLKNFQQQQHMLIQQHQQHQTSLSSSSSSSSTNIPISSQLSSANNSALNTSAKASNRSSNAQSLMNSSLDESQMMKLQKNDKLLNGINLRLPKGFSECFHILQKPELYETLKLVLFDDANLKHMNNSQDEVPHKFHHQPSVYSNENNTKKLFKRSSQLVNFMQQKKYKWVISKEFHTQTAQNLKETIIDTLVRIRLKEGFKFLYQCSKFAVFTIQLSMFDSGDIGHSNSDGSSPKNQTSNQQFRNGSSQYCTFIYIIRFKNNIVHNADPLTIGCPSNINLASNKPANNGLLTTTTANNDIKDDKEKSNKTNPSVTTPLSLIDESSEVYFTTEIYVEAIDGIYQERRNNYNFAFPLNPVPSNSNPASSTASTTSPAATSSNKNSANMSTSANICGFSKKQPPPPMSPSNQSHTTKLENRYSDSYFRNLTNMEIANLIYLTDLKCYSALQSSYSLFLPKTSPISNLSSFINSSPSETLKNNLRTRIQYSILLNTYSVFANTVNANVYFFESIRFLPELSLVFNNKNNLKKQDDTRKFANNTTSNFRSSTTNLHNRIKLPFKSDFDSTKLNSSLDSRTRLHQESQIQEITQNLSQPKKKKKEYIQLFEQLRPILDCIDTSPTGTSLNIDFEFTLRGLLFESALYVCVFDDIPFNLFGSNINDKNVSKNEMITIQKIQSLFNNNIDGYLKNVNELSSQKNEDEVKSYNSVIDKMKKELRNAIVLKLNDIKHNDSITKQIVDSLHNQLSGEVTGESNQEKNDQDSNFKAYIKFSISPTAPAAASSFSNSFTNQSWTNNNMNNTSSSSSNSASSNRFRNINLMTQNQAQNDSENNKFFIYGLFFLNNTNVITQQKQRTSRLVFFMFNCAPDNVKSSLIHTQTNTYLIRKSLFCSKKKNDGKPNSYQFYTSKNYQQNAPSSSVNTLNVNTALNLNNSNLIKKCSTISDILKFNMLHNQTSNDASFFSILDSVEEMCAKCYIKSVIHYIGSYAPSIAKMPSLANLQDGESIPAFDPESISQLLKLGHKIKLIDLDLSDYLRMICSHVSGGEKSRNDSLLSKKHKSIDDEGLTMPSRLKLDETNEEESDKEEENCAKPDSSSVSLVEQTVIVHNEQKESLTELVEDQKILFDWVKCCKKNRKIKNEYLEKKFDEIFLKKFNLLPGFNDLFIFTSGSVASVIAENIEQAEQGKKKRPDSLINEQLNATPSSLEDDDEQDNDEFDAFSNNEEDITNDYDEYDEMGDHMNDDEHSNDDEYDLNDSESDEHLNEDVYDECDSDCVENIRKTGRHNLTGRRNIRLLNKMKSSSPFSSTTGIYSKKKLSARFARSNLTSKQISPSGASTGSTNATNEQIIGLEFVCIIETSDELIDSDLNGLENLRTRTTTLTPENNLDPDSATTTATSTMVNDENPAILIESNLNKKINNNSNNNKIVFYSKFTKFNLTCLLDLIEQKDMNEFKSIINKLETLHNEQAIPSIQSVTVNNFRVYLRFNWYSFNQLNIQNSFQILPSNMSNSKILTPNGSNTYSMKINQPPKIQAPKILSSSVDQQPQLLQMNKLQKQTSYAGTGIPSGTGNMSTHSSSSTVYNPGGRLNRASLKSALKFDYNHLLYPRLHEFKWHLRDEIFQMQQTEFENMRVFYAHMMHIKEGVNRQYYHCHFDKRTIILSKKKHITTITQIDPMPNTNAAMLPNSNASHKQNTTTIIEEDKSIIAVDPSKFMSEFIQMIKNLDGKFHKCKLQQMNESFYYLDCLYTDKDEEASSDLKEKSLLHTFKILISLNKKNVIKNPNKPGTNKNSKAPSPTIATESMPQFTSLRSPGVNSSIDNNINNQASHTSANRKQTIHQPMSVNPKSLKPQQQQMGKQVQQTTEIHINQLKIKLYFGFNHTSFQNKEPLIQRLITEFNNQLDSLIKSVYLTLCLKEIHDSRKWNSLLTLKQSNQGSNNLDCSTNNEDTVDESVNSKSTLECNCVWWVLFKLHRLHQTTQKIHTVGDASIPSAQTYQQSQQQLTLQQQQQASNQISQGLKKLQESLVNFKIDESTCGDLYEYTHKNEIYLLKLEEVYETQATSCSSNQTTLTQMQNLDENSLSVNDSSVEINEKSISASIAKIQQQNKLNVLSRRPSYASINDTNDISNRTSNFIKTQNLSGGSQITQIAAGLQANTTFTNNQSTASSSTKQPSYNPEYIKLSVYGLQEPSEEMKQNLCKSLQSELDYWLLNRMCNSIDKNTYKTTSAQHPDKITDEDLTFFKQIADNYFDYEIPLPFVFNFNRTLRDNFFFFAKQIFNSNFKAIDAPMANPLQQILSSTTNLNHKKPHQQSGDSHKYTSSPSDPNKNAPQDTDEYDELNRLLCSSELTPKHQQAPFVSKSHTTTTQQPVSNIFTQQLSFSFVSVQPSLGPMFNSNMNKSTSASLSSNLFLSNKRSISNDLDPLSILLTRILFHNAKNARIGKHSVSLVLVEALYSIKGLDYLVSSRITRSNSIGTNQPGNSTGVTFSKQLSQQQLLETSYTQSKQTGPTFVFRFYCRGENDTNNYKASLKSALNDALLYFLSEYLTKIEPELYLKMILLKSKPAKFRINTVIDLSGSNLYSSDFGDKLNKRKRHKSTGNDMVNNKQVNTFTLNMNKSAKETKLGQLLLNLKISDINQLNNYIINNFSNNLFDHRDYQDTIEYFRESIKQFDFNRIFNFFISKSIRSSKTPLHAIIHSDEDEDSDIGANARFGYDQQSRSTSSSGSECGQTSISLQPAPSLMLKPQRSLSLDPDKYTSSKFKDLKSNSSSRGSADSGSSYSKSHLRIIYDWLKCLHLMHARSSINFFRPILPSVSSNSQRSMSTNVSSNQIVQSPVNVIGNPLSATNLASSGSSTGGQSSLVLRKRFNYKTKYNLINLVRDLESGLKDTCKCDITTSYYSFTSSKKSAPKACPSHVESAEDMDHDEIELDLTSCDDDDRQSVASNGSNKSKQKSTTANTSACTITNDNVFLEDDKVPEQTKVELKSCLRNKSTPLTNIGSYSYNDIEDEDLEYFGNDFENLKQTKFSDLHTNLSRSQNIIITFNAEYTSCSVGSVSSNTGISNSVNSGISSALSLSMSSSMNSSQINTSAVSATGPTTYSRVPSFGNSAKDTISTSATSSTSSSATLTTQSMTSSTSSSSTTSSAVSNHSNSTMIAANTTQNNNPNSNNLMIKSMSSNSGELDSSMSLSNSLALAALQLKRTYCYALVHAKSRTITFYCFTTESGNYESIKSLLDQAYDIITQRFHLVNNTVLYKFGGLIGDNLIYDLKRVKTLTHSACHINQQQTSDSLNDSLSQTAFHELASKSSVNVPAATINKQLAKVSKSPTIHRQLSYKATVHPINSALIVNLPFNTTNPPPPGNIGQLCCSVVPTQQQATSNVSVLSGASTAIPTKQLVINQFNLKSYDSIINIINQQISFCCFYLNSPTGSPLSASSNNLIIQNSTILDNPNLSAQNINFKSSPYTQSNPLANNVISTSSGGRSQTGLYGVGVCYQLFEMQQLYRHPKKIYELAMNLSSSNQNNVLGTAGNKPMQATTNINVKSPLNANSGVVSSVQTGKNQLNVNDFYKNYVQPVLIPFHYCCTPLLFYSSWEDSIITENMLKSTTMISSSKANMLNTSKSEAILLQSISTNSTNSGVNKIGTSSSLQTQPSNNTQVVNSNTTEQWYTRMRQIVLSEYSKYFESRGFIRLKDDIQPSGPINSKQNIAQQEVTTHHFFKWVQQEGFFYLKISLEEIYLHVNLGYCARYRSASTSFINELIKFFTKDFHVHSFVYDFQLSAINSNFIQGSVTGSQISQTSQTIARFLDQFVDFFGRVPMYSNNKVFKIIHEKSDSSLIPHRLRLIFDFIIQSRKKLAMDSAFSLLLKPLFVFDNNIAIYVVNDSNSSGKPVDYLKFLVIRIENYTTSSFSSSSSSPLNNYSTNQSLAGSGSKKTQTNQSSKVQTVSSSANLSKLSHSSSSSSLITSAHADFATLHQQTKSANQSESYIRIVSYYLCINKNQHSVENPSSLVYISQLNKFSKDIEFISKVIEESINQYKQKIFWDNLTLSMSSLKRMINESTSSISNSTILTGFSVNSQELEQILAISRTIDIIDLDPSLRSFMKECYSVKDRILNNLKSWFGTNFIYTNSDSFDYCLLLIDDELIKNFRYCASVNTDPQGSSPTSSSDYDNSDQQLKSFILIKFDRLKKNAHLWKVNRVNKDEEQQQQQFQFKRSNTNDFSGASTSNQTHKHLSFTVNILMLILWKSLFGSS